jgi:hypothetical protein
MRHSVLRTIAFHHDQAPKRKFPSGVNLFTVWYTNHPISNLCHYTSVVWKALTLSAHPVWPRRADDRFRKICLVDWWRILYSLQLHGVVHAVCPLPYLLPCTGATRSNHSRGPAMKSAVTGCKTRSYHSTVRTKRTTQRFILSVGFVYITYQPECLFLEQISVRKLLKF